ncbi:MAG: hypothetical protein LKG79_07555 [Furfurilactobacillus sp.]|jgi:hypothetical protein|uniref:hypothetical protein n=1 Tax=Furfurilactobacillus sp. TaxID=2767911 RepID=UPI00258961AC|nr:hypothetical protein [Furfurilactobacillus sp.]MCH4010602.1 hypothetical protein [Furfurilactobacillus sp.]MCH4036494.1 hypothetical protein [Furfurilactobacillus sp.]MCH4114560.1 hypothetical protein [Furfurilactobacillus sp.]MCH4133821.1 hypothetical protein [Furfurilactobacillus sp.]MCI1340142.1 hypothetical protein [Furfurilactobacillus sp.]
MSSTNQTHKEYLAHRDGTVYWPITAWDAILGIPNDLAHKSDIPTLTKADISWHTSGFSYLNGIEPIDGQPMAKYQAVKLGNVQHVTLQVYFTNASGNGDIVMLDPNMPKDSSVPTMIGGWCDGNGNRQLPSRLRVDWDSRKLTLEAYDPESMKNNSWFYFEKDWWCDV